MRALDQPNPKVPESHGCAKYDETKSNVWQGGFSLQVHHAFDREGGHFAYCTNMF